jgi:hypothetical protein
MEDKDESKTFIYDYSSVRYFISSPTNLECYVVTEVSVGPYHA